MSRLALGTRVVDLGHERALATKVWVDGSGSRQGMPSGCGVYIEHGVYRWRRAVHLGPGTSNTAELNAAIEGLTSVARLRLPKGYPVDLYSDSEYTIGCIAHDWQPAANRELIARARAVYTALGGVLIVKVKGHAGVVGNEVADQLAKAGRLGTNFETCFRADTGEYVTVEQMSFRREV